MEGDIAFKIWDICEKQVQYGSVQNLLNLLSINKPHLELISLQFAEKVLQENFEQIQVYDFYSIKDERQEINQKIEIKWVYIETFDNKLKIMKTLKVKFLEIQKNNYETNKILNLKSAVKGLLRTDLVLKIYDIFLFKAFNILSLYLIIEQEHIYLPLQIYKQTVRENNQSLDNQILSTQINAIKYCSKKQLLKQLLDNEIENYSFYILKNENNEILVKLNPIDPQRFIPVNNSKDTLPNKSENNQFNKIEFIDFNTILDCKLKLTEQYEQIENKDFIQFLQQKCPQLLEQHDIKIFEIISNNNQYNKFDLEEYNEDFFIIKTNIEDKKYNLKTIKIMNENEQHQKFLTKYYDIINNNHKYKMFMPLYNSHLIKLDNYYYLIQVEQDIQIHRLDSINQQDIIQENIFTIRDVEQNKFKLYKTYENKRDQVKQLIILQLIVWLIERTNQICSIQSKSQFKDIYVEQVGDSIQFEFFLSNPLFLQHQMNQPKKVIKKFQKIINSLLKNSNILTFQYSQLLKQLWNSYLVAIGKLQNQYQNEIKNNQNNFNQVHNNDLINQQILDNEQINNNQQFNNENINYDKNFNQNQQKQIIISDSYFDKMKDELEQNKLILIKLIEIKSIDINLNVMINDKKQIFIIQYQDVSTLSQNSLNQAILRGLSIIQCNAYSLMRYLEIIDNASQIKQLFIQDIMPSNIRVQDISQKFNMDNFSSVFSNLQLLSLELNNETFQLFDPIQLFNLQHLDQFIGYFSIKQLINNLQCEQQYIKNQGQNTLDLIQQKISNLLLLFKKNTKFKRIQLKSDELFYINSFELIEMQTNQKTIKHSYFNKQRENIDILEIEIQLKIQEYFQIKQIQNIHEQNELIKQIQNVLWIYFSLDCEIQIVLDESQNHYLQIKFEYITQPELGSLVINIEINEENKLYIKQIFSKNQEKMFCQCIQIIQLDQIQLENIVNKWHISELSSYNMRQYFNISEQTSCCHDDSNQIQFDIYKNQKIIQKMHFFLNICPQVQLKLKNSQNYFSQKYQQFDQLIEINLVLQKTNKYLMLNIAKNIKQFKKIIKINIDIINLYNQHLDISNCFSFKKILRLVDFEITFK